MSLLRTWCHRPCGSLCALIALWWVVGCQTASHAPATSLPAALTLVNRTSYSWRVEFSQGGETTDNLRLEVPPLGAQRVELPAGRYAVSLRARSAAGDLVHRTAAEIHAGEEYDWPLVTLLGAPPSVAPP